MKQEQTFYRVLCDLANIWKFTR